MSLTEKLAAAKEKAAERQFEVTITELLKKTVTVVAKDKFEAEQMVSDFWRNSMYILDADDFHSVEFEANQAGRVRLPPAKGKEGNVL
jgi:hypothetical protein